MGLKDQWNELRKAVAAAVAPKATSSELAAFPTGIWTGLTPGGRRGLTDHQGDPKEMMKNFRSIVFACINARAKAVANAGQSDAFKVMYESGVDEYNTIESSHPLVQLLRYPNPYITRWNLWYLTVTYLDLMGNSYWWGAKDKMNVPRSFWPLPADKVKIVPGDPKKDEEIIKSYIINWGMGNFQEFPAEDVIHLKYPNPMDPYFYGASLMMRAAQEVDIDWFIKDHQREFFRNDATPPAVIIFKQQLSRPARVAFEQAWIEKYQRKPGQIGYLEADATIQTLQNQKELDYLSSAPTIRRAVQAVFGVPDSELGMEERIRATATQETLEYNFAKKTVEPLLTMIDEQLTLDLARELYDQKLTIVHQSTVPKDVKLQVEVDKEELMMGKVSINEVRKRDGLEEIEGGDEPLVSTLLAPLSAVVGGTAKPQQPAEPPKSKGLLDALSEDEKRSLWRRHERPRAAWERHLTERLKRWFRHVKRDALETIRDNAAAIRKDLDPPEKLEFNVDEWLDALSGVVRSEAIAMLRDAFDRFAQEQSIRGIQFNPRSPRVLAGLERLAQKTRTIPEDLHDALVEQIRLGLEANEDPTQVAGRVATWFDGQTDYRALRIARTNTNYALNKGNEIAASEARIFDTKIWLTMRDDRVRDIHAVMDGAEVSMQGVFELPNGDHLEEPGDMNAMLAESVINCFPGSTLVSASSIKKIFRGHYSGTLITIKTARGNKLTGTPNHPVLTERGFVALRCLTKGDSVFNCPIGQPMTVLDPDVQRTPSMIGEVFHSLSMAHRVCRIDPLRVNFYGDRLQGNVDVIGAQGELEDRSFVHSNELFKEEEFSSANFGQGSHARDSLFVKFVCRSGRGPSRLVGGAHECQAFSPRQALHSQCVGLTDSPEFDTEALEILRYGRSSDAGFARELQDRLSRFVRLDQVTEVNSSHVGPIDVFTMETANGIYTASDQSATAYGIITRNCRCTILFSTKGVD